MICRVQDIFNTQPHRLRHTASLLSGQSLIFHRLGSWPVSCRPLARKGKREPHRLCPAAAAEPLSSLQSFRAVFLEWDTDKDGCLDKHQFHELLVQISKGLHPFTLDWLKSVELDDLVFSYDTNQDGKISLEELEVLIQDCSIVEGKLQEYREAFEAIDSSGDGTLNGGELSRAFQALGQPIKPEKLAKIMNTVDRDMNGRVSWTEFIGIFRHELLDLQAIQDFVRMRPQCSKKHDGKLVEAMLGEVQMLFSEEEFDCLLQSNHDRLIILEAGLTWCRPCKGFERTFQKFAVFYDNTIFLRFYGNSNESCRHLFANRLHASATPNFSFFRAGKLVHQFTGANAGKLNEALQTHLLDHENPLAGASIFKRQVWNSNIGIK